MSTTENILESLREQALKLKVSHFEVAGSTLSVDTIITTLQALQASYSAFLKYQFVQDNPIRLGPKSLDHAKGRIAAEGGLHVVDLSFASLGIQLAPNMYADFGPRYLSWSKEAFAKYQQDFVFFTFAPGQVEAFTTKYPDPEANLQILRPLFRLRDAQNGLKVEAAAPLRDLQVINEIPEKTQKLYLEQVQPVPEPIDTEAPEMRLIYAVVKPGADPAKLSKKDIQDISYTQPIPFGTHPYRVTELPTDGEVLRFQQAIVGEVSVEEDEFIIGYGPWSISVKAATREEAEIQFEEALRTLYNDYALAESKDLDRKGKALKKSFNQTLVSE
ncbi:MAG TPA: hypothetical protein DCE41_27170 [Cytophagales bacterium]|nr:hypothetical protein [Cytophagales bacterium]